MNKILKRFFIALVLCCAFIFAEAYAAEFKLSITSHTDPYVLRDPKFILSVDGAIIRKAYTGTHTTGAYEREISVNAGSITDVKLVDIESDSYETFGISEQSWDGNTLHVKLGRNITVSAKTLESYGFMDMFDGKKGIVKGLTLGLYQNDVLKYKTENFLYAGDIPSYRFLGIAPGKYKLKVLDASESIKEKLDLTRTFDFEIDKKGKATLDGKGPLGVTSSNDVYKDGVKTPFSIWFSRIPSLDKLVSNLSGTHTLDFTDPNPTEFKKTVAIKPGDELKFRITREIGPDNNYSIEFPGTLKYSSKIEIDFHDPIQKGLSFIEGSLQIFENGAPANDFNGTFDGQKVVVTHTSKENKFVLDFNNPIKLPPKRTIQIEFRCKVDNGVTDPIMNIAFGNGKESKVEMKPVPTPTPTPTPTIPSITPNIKIPQTGDEAHIELYLIFGLIAVLSIAFITVSRRKK
ncbi:MAG: LPXTG cell wall anchor domain-containing protein [Eubacteriales bacterium]|nr:LPXTG cell wall anchor domain-containing protein [Eubacteriales bacterium]